MTAPIRGGQGRDPESLSGDARTVSVCFWIACLVAGIWAIGWEIERWLA